MYILCVKRDAKMQVYLDNSATTKPYVEVAKAVYDTMLETYANPSSLHSLGKRAEDLLTSCRQQIASTVYGTPEEIYFTSGGTESDNIAIIGYAMANKRKSNRIITQSTEHSAVLETFSYLQSQGFEVLYVPVTSDGCVDLDALREMVKEPVLLMSFMYVNNETGAILPIEEISRIAKREKIALHIDAVQAYGKIAINVKTLGCDMLTLSSHKIHGPNGVGALYVKKGTKIKSTVYGGGQEKGLRSGTENLAGIAGFAKASEIKFASFDEDIKKMQSLKERLKDGILKEIDNAVINSPENSVCSVLNVSFEGVRSEVLLHVLESNGIYVSSGSACNSKKESKSYVLSSMNLSRSRIDSAIRFSLSAHSTEEEIDYCIDVLAREVPKLLKIMR